MLARSVIESISDPKRTGLGTGRFVTTRMDYVAVPDAEVPAGDPLSPEQLQALFERRRAGGHHALPHPQVPAGHAHADAAAARRGPP